MLSWLASLTTYWQAIITFVITAIVAFSLHELDINALKAVQSVQLASEAKSLVAECQQDKQITREVSSEYEIEIANLNTQLSATNSLYDNQWVRVTGPTRSNHGSTSGPGHATTYEIPAGKLIEYAGDSEKYRLQLKSCQEFIKKTWDEQKQPLTP